MRDGVSDDGMLAHFGLLVWPETGGVWKNVDRYPDGPPWSRSSPSIGSWCRPWPSPWRTGNAARWALHWCVYLQTHARLCYESASSGEAETASMLMPY